MVMTLKQTSVTVTTVMIMEHDNEMIGGTHGHDRCLEVHNLGRLGLLGRELLEALGLCHV